MSSIATPFDSPRASAPSGALALSARQCRLALAALVLLTFAAHLVYLAGDCPIDLAEDEAYYWDWSRRLDISYYSKGPATASLIRASCAVFGDTPLGVRFPALLLRVGFSVCLWWLARRLFGSERLALAAVALSYFAPMLLATGLIMTTDPPFLFCWGLATCLACAAVFDGKGWAWPAVGVAVGLGFLAKFNMPMWLVGLLLFLLLDAQSRPLLRTRRPWLALAAFLPFTLPVLVWNHGHGWVTFLHVSEDVGLSQGRVVAGNILDFWTGQMSVIGPLLFLLIILAVVRSILFLRKRPGPNPATCHERRAVRFLLCMGMPVFLAVFLSSFRTHVANNWIASSYFAFLILTAWCLSRELPDPRRWRLWRLLLYPALVTGLALVLIAHNTERLYPLVAQYNTRFPDRALSLRRIDPTYRLHGWSEIGAKISMHVQAQALPPMLMAEDYQTTAQLAFYVAGQPKTWCVGSYFSHGEREPFSQYNIWPDRRLDPSSAEQLGLRGRDAIYLGQMNDDLRRAFASVSRLPDVVVRRHGLEVRRLEVWQCSGFAGLPWPGWVGKYNK